MLDIKSMGSKWAGEEPDTIDDLLKMLREHPLQRTFEACGNFCHQPVWIEENPYPDIDPKRLWCFFGNFFTYAFGFTVYTDDQEIIERVRKAIWVNQRRPDYRSQDPPRYRGRLVNFAYTDISWELAKDAHRATSFSPELRADQAVSSYMTHMAQIDWEFRGYVKSGTSKAEAMAALERYRQGYIKRYSAYLSAHSRCMSAMITGPANFPTRRNQKANASADNRLNEWLEWDKKVLDKLRRQFDPVRIANAPISSDDPDAIEQLQAKIDDAQKTQELMKAANAIIRKKKLTNAEKVEALAQLEGIDQRQAIKLMGGDYMGRQGYPPYALQNNNANIRRMKQRIEQLRKEAEHAAQSEDGEKETIIAGVRVVENFDENRLQLFFDGKPPADTRQRLKSRGFRRAPSQGAWQRLLNNNARSVVKYAITGQY